MPQGTRALQCVPAVLPGRQQGLTQGQDDSMIDLPGVPERERPSHFFQPSQQPCQAGGRAPHRGSVLLHSTCQV